ncbi:Putative glycosyltransferase [Nitrosotalea devaniterrae]|uniref:Glycosyltransferase n=1 Tax=Nitrosotalea devaniterrae TaxID=1078905 RepID=A0A128A0L5_9ARCH|nr:Putative glycosyltransferase [Candidatus Nitrosotalea devanaterra]
MVKKTKQPPQEPKESKYTLSKRDNIVSWAVFLPTLVIVFISLVSVVFPALVARTTSPFQDEIYKPDVIDPFQTGLLAAPLIIVNVIILLIGISYYKRSMGRDFFKKISNFDLSQKQALIVLATILVIFSGVMASQIGTEETWDDYKDVKDRIHSWTVSDFAKSFEPHVRFLLLSVSQNVFDNIRVIPLVSSIALLALTYFFTVKITENRFAGIISAVLLLQSNVFLTYDSSATYDSFWILLYLFSLYLIYKKWPGSPASFIASIFSKALTILFLPMSIFFIARSGVPRKSMIYHLVCYGAIVLLLVIIAVALQTNYAGTSLGFDTTDFWKGFTAIAIQMRFDYLILLFLLPLTVMLFIASRKGILHADSIQIFILSILIAAPFLIGFTTQTNQPYRFVSLAVFFAIGTGVLLSKKTRKQDGLLSI